MTTDEAHAAAVAAWREQRYAALGRDAGWLTLAGLDWLKPGINTLGTAPESDVRLPSGPATAGTVVVRAGAIAASGVFMHEGTQADNLPLTTDGDGEPTMLVLGDLRLCVIERGGRLAIRTWDTASAARRAFSGIDHWPIDPRWRLDARYEPARGRVVQVPDVLGIVEEEESPADVVFEIDGAAHRLQGLAGGPDGQLWLVFADLTNGVETYGGGRFVYTGPPAPDGSVELDFNRAYNPPCVFSPFATCPLPWPANRLPIRIEAGERSFHSSADR